MGFALSDLELTSDAFAHHGKIPARQTGEGEDVSPALRWTNVPHGTKGFALVCHDPDAPLVSPGSYGFVHWVLYNIPGDVTRLPEGLPRQPVLQVPAGARQGLNSWPENNIGYRGPLPPRGSGPHRYYFSLYALDTPITLPPHEATAAHLQDLIADHVLAEAQTMGIYERRVPRK